MTDHARLSASGSSRWLNCSPSIMLEEEFVKVNGQPQTSHAASEGTLAHALAELHLRKHTGKIAQRTFSRHLSKIKKDDLYTTEMPGQVEKFTAYVLEQLSGHEGAELGIEERLDFSEFVPKGFGTGDACVYAGTHLEIIDLKYGKGVRVSALGNSQLRLYALGALQKVEFTHDIQTVRMTIVQPRLDAISSVVMAADDLLFWAENTIVPAAKKAIAGEGQPITGDWCRFCKAKPKCRAWADLTNEVDRADFEAAPKVVDSEGQPILTDKELLYNYNRAKAVMGWLKQVQDYVYDQALTGKKWEGLKLVEGRSSRRWSDEAGLQLKLQELGIPEDDYLSVKVKGITVISALTKEDLGAYTIKPPGKPALVAEDDKRPALGIEQAKLDFK